MAREKEKLATYEIGGLCVEMTADQAARWNAGETTDRDLDVIAVKIPEPQNQARRISLRRATNARLEKDVANAMCGSSANRCG